MNQALYAHMNNKRKMKKKRNVFNLLIKILPGQKSITNISKV
jgi:hypothetical protein